MSLAQSQPRLLASTPSACDQHFTTSSFSCFGSAGATALFFSQVPSARFSSSLPDL